MAEIGGFFIKIWLIYVKKMFKKLNLSSQLDPGCEMETYNLVSVNLRLNQKPSNFINY